MYSSGMKLRCFVLFVAFGAAACAGRPAIGPFLGDEENSKGTKWAMLVAGSAGWGNYRHQADICHAYQVLKAGGLKDENIVVMMADDLVSNQMNPHPGQIFNKPNGPDVYEGVLKDYTGSTVTAANVLKVLAGDAEAMEGVGSGKVIASGPDDTVFFYFADHGAPGILGMPFGPFLYADKFVDTLVNKSMADGFNKMVVYIEACESGSVFRGFNISDSRMYATTAANAVESSWGTYCPGMTPSLPHEFNTCLGDLYSVAFLEDMDAADRRHESLEAEYKKVEERVSNHHTYQMGSHVEQFGDMSFLEDPIGKYVGFGTGTSEEGASSFFSGLLAGRVRRAELLETDEQLQQLAVKQRDAELVYLETRAEREQDPALKAQYEAELKEFMRGRSLIDAVVLRATALMLQDDDVFVSVSESLEALMAPDQMAEMESHDSEILFGDCGRPQDMQVVDDWDCLRAMVDAYEAECGPLGQYGMRYSRTFANVCNLGLSDAFTGSITEACITTVAEMQELEA